MIPKLRLYQARALSLGRQAIREGSRRPLFVAPTGAGKTVLASAMAAGHLERVQDARVLFVAHRRELLTQSAATMRRFDLAVGIDGEGRGAPVQVASIQAILARNEVPDCTMAVFDEAHHYVSEEWISVPNALRSIAKPPLIVGLTATPERGDGAGLCELFDSLTTVAQISELVELNRVDPTQGLSDSKIVSVRDALGSNEIAREPADAWIEFGEGLPAVVFAANIAAAEAFAEAFVQRGYRATAVHDRLGEKERRARLDGFAAGEFDALCNVAILTEGWDCPRAKCVIFARKVGSISLMIQMAGRGIRPYENQRAIMIDLCGVFDTLGPHDQELEYSLEGRAVRRKGEATGVRLCKVCGVVVEQGEACSGCGRKGKQLGKPNCVEADLVVFDRAQWAAQRARSARGVALAERYGRHVVSLAEWTVLAREKQHKPNAAVTRFQRTFRRWPSKEERAQCAAVLARMRELELEAMHTTTTEAT